VVIGHSERRQHHNETDEVVRDKVRAAHRHGLAPILCVGENLEVRRAEGHVDHAIHQINRALDGAPADLAETLVVAYEPIWAIGTGEVATPEDAQEVCAAIRGRLVERFGAEEAAGIRVLYGGSVKASNVAGIMSQPDVDGALVGGASLDPDEFVRICRFRESSET
jgi:triosephosphate isomerase